jgi:hypothetical protein
LSIALFCKLILSLIAAWVVSGRLYCLTYDKAGELRYRDTAGLLSEMLLLTRGQANARVTAADSFGPRRSPTGEVLAPRLPAAAAR